MRFLRMQSWSSRRWPAEPETESTGTRSTTALGSDRAGATAPWFFLLLLAAQREAANRNRHKQLKPVPVVPISHPVKRPVTDSVDFTGRTGKVQSVNVVTPVTGYLFQMPFAEGAEVKEGDLLFEIDPQPYDAQSALWAWPR